MKNRLISAICIMIVMLGIFILCKKSDGGTSEKETSVAIPEEIEWKQQTKKTDSQNWMTGTADCMCAKVDGVNYCFDQKSFQKEDADAFVKDAQMLIQYAETIIPRNEEAGDIFFNITVRKDRIEVGKTRTFDSLWQVLERVCKVNAAEQYGLFYRYCVKQGLLPEESKGQEITKEDLCRYFGKEENLYLLDFCLPMVETQFFREEQAKLTRAAVIDFAEWFEKTYSEREYEKLCRTIDKTEGASLESYKNAWLTDLGLDANYREFGKLIFLRLDEFVAYAGNTATILGKYEVDCGDVLWVWNKESVDAEGYRDMVAEFRKVEPLRKNDFAEARNFLKGYTPEKIRKVKIYFNFSDKQNRASAMMISDSQIVLHYDWFDAACTLVHEYCHILTIGKDKLIPTSGTPWTEGVAEWLAVFEMKNEMRQLMVKEQTERLKKIGQWKEDYTKQQNAVYATYKYFLEDVENEASRDLSKEVKGDEGFPFYILPTRMSYQERATVTYYIYETYGLEKLAELTGGGMDFEKVLGKSLEQLYFEAAGFAKERLAEMNAK